MLIDNTQTKGPPYSALSRELLLIYAVYRLSLTLVIWGMFLTHTVVGQDQPGLFIITALAYLLINIGLLSAAKSNWQPEFLALFLIVASDIVAIQLVAQSSGNISSGVSVLMVISVAAGSLFLQSKTAFIVPAFASITLLLSVSAGVIHQSANTESSVNLAEIVASGWLGILFFLASALTNYLSGRVEKSDLRAQREYENAQNLQHLNSLIIDRMQTGVLLVNPTGEVISCNKAASELLRIGSNSSFQHLSQIDPRLQDFLKSQLKLTAAQQSSNTSDPTTQNLNHAGRNLKFTWINLTDSNDADFLVFVEDLSKIAQQAQQLKLSSLGKLTASIAHEIRNPLGAANHAAQLLQEEESTPENARLSEIIINQTRRCSDIIESVLSVSRGGQSSIQQFDLMQWLPSFLKDYQLGNACEIAVGGETRALIRFDQSQLAQILSNLLDNATRHSEQSDGSRRVTLFVSIDSLQRPRLDIFDTGEGVNREDELSLFEPFFTRSKQGSGLGLYICRELCEANQATVDYIEKPLEKFSGTISSDIDSREDNNFFAAITRDHCFRIQFSHPNRTAIFTENDSPIGQPIS